MSVNTVGTYSLFQSTLNDVSTVENNLTTEQGQLSSDKESSNFAGMAQQTQQYLSIDNILGKTTQYLNDNQIIETNISTTSNALGGIISTAQSLQSLISEASSGTGDNAAFSTQLQGLWSQIADQMNTTVNNQYIFSGTATSTAPVNPNQFPTTLQPGVPDTSYYLGSQQDLTARPQDNTEITYNVRADSSGFQNLMAGLAMAMQAGTTQNNDDYSTAESLVATGIQDLINTKATVDANTVQYKTIDTNLNNSQLYWQGIQQGIGNTDIVSVSTQVAVNQGILQASFQAFASINSLFQQLASDLKS